MVFVVGLRHDVTTIMVSSLGNVVDRLAIRDGNKCKDFKWYLMNVANDTIRTKYQPHRGEGQVSEFTSTEPFLTEPFLHQ